jgi:hypothetical protein
LLLAEGSSARFSSGEQIPYWLCHACHIFPNKRNV